ncbi:hypothetical protein M422DRAFT_273945 [Sphaerobolus stellatus SS14]|uniref:Uncharacterized protein n=1 Tax=Sphaerobolus stellatus (strain SS14) TaxID=990650 RepID=A0A0C9TTC4_SPHS4|nr:hypothetical protein M422DRAFT_273945 [Sphaerobolus stellatus SS14]
MDKRFLDCGLALLSGNDDTQLNTILEFLPEGDDDDEGAEGDIRDGEQPGADQEDCEYINIDDMDGYDDDEWDEIYFSFEVLFSGMDLIDGLRHYLYNLSANGDWSKGRDRSLTGRDQWKMVRLLTVAILDQTDGLGPVRNQNQTAATLLLEPLGALI